MNLYLDNKVVIVTGGGQGIGKAYSLAFAEEGARVVVVDLNPETIKQVASEITNQGGRTLAVKADVSRWDEVSNVVRRTLETFGGVDILVNNAGFRGFALVEEMSDEHWDREINVNLKGVFYFTKAVVPYMKEHRYGKIINQSSTAAFGHPFRGSSYAAAKAGVLGFSRSMAKELGPFNINVNAICPGATRTAFMAGMPPEKVEAEKKTSPLGRIGEAEDCVGIVLLLASDRARQITGQTIIVDGGVRTT